MTKFISKVRETILPCVLSSKNLGKFKSSYVLADISSRFDENQRYDYFHWYYASKVPKRIRDHRRYFQQFQRGFGENAFHAMWWMILSEFRPIRMLEIGVYRGQAISLWALIGQELKLEKMEIWGLSPLVGAGDSVSSYMSIDYRHDINMNHEHFNLEAPNLFEAYSNEKKGIDFVSARVWDLIYIDGSHELEVVRADVALATAALKDGGILVLDDASLYSNYSPSRISFAGHPGPSTVAIEVEKEKTFASIGTCGHNRIYMKRPVTID